VELVLIILLVLLLLGGIPAYGYRNGPYGYGPVSLVGLLVFLVVVVLLLRLLGVWV
jgi:hypothetical protein